MKLSPVALLVAGVVALATPVHATPCIEIGDADQLPAVAQNCGSGVTSISGVLGVLDKGTLTGGSDVDMFRLNLVGGVLFTATTLGLTNNGSGGPVDNMLFLFDSLGKGLIDDDDTPPANGEASFSYLPLTSGVYYLAIGLYGITPESVAGAIFPDPSTVPDTHVPYGPTGPGAAQPVSSWPGSGVAFTCSDGEDGPNVPCPVSTYTINLTATATVVPEPTSAALLGGGLLGLVAALRHRRRG